jgi:hypothetical protein
MAPALKLLGDNCAQSAAGLLVAEEMDQLVNVFSPACAAIGWQVRRCYWEGRHGGSGVWAAEALRMCLLLLCGLLGDKAKLSEYARSISVALLAWTPWHDAVPAAAYVEEACEAQLAKLASALKRNPHATGVEEVSDLYVLLPRADEQPHPAKHHPVSQPLLRALVANLDHFVAMGPEVVTTVPWRSGKTCVATTTIRPGPSTLRAPWSTTTQDVRAVLLHALSRVSRGDPVTRAVAQLADTFLPLRTQTAKEEYLTALAGVDDLLRRNPPPPRTRALVRELTVRDRTDPPHKRRRTTAPPRRVRARSTGATAGDILLSHPAYTGPRLVGIPQE